MPITRLIDSIRDLTAEDNVATHLRRGRSLVSQVIFGKSYEQALAAERAGVLGLPALIPERTEQLRLTYHDHVDVVANAASLLLPYWPSRHVKTATEAQQSGTLPSYPDLTPATLEQLHNEAEKKGMTYDWITFNPGTLRQGKHLRFVATNGAFYALEDFVLEDGTTRKTAIFNNTVFRYHSKREPEDSHQFLTHVFEDNKWELRPTEHALTDEDEFDLTLAEISFG